MKLVKRKIKSNVGSFSGTVEVVVTGIDGVGRRMGREYRHSFRIAETTVEEVYNIIYEALDKSSK